MLMPLKSTSDEETKDLETADYLKPLDNTYLDASNKIPYSSYAGSFMHMVYTLDRRKDRTSIQVTEGEGSKRKTITEKHVVLVSESGSLYLGHFLDGKTRGPKAFSEEIGKQLENCEKLPVRSFQKIDVILPILQVQELSTDQKCLYEIWVAISTCNIASGIFHKDPAKMSYSKWLTTVNRILRLDIVFIITEPPLTTISDDELKEMISGVSDEIEILKFPCHSQAVDRCVELVTEALAAACVNDARHGFIRNRIASRVTSPIFETKEQYTKPLEN
ncbi:hypothetical protein ILUMI_27402 [Ignelater luminosus]|uniref:Uncharacterized protein n=1 Tax=Ignelater luminosus TaxID=2038154 RepID=A0A8K0FVN3_IGNLU|nr:hypothetical protein ILUMI_27402 [Ignelater luminosus]